MFTSDIIKLALAEDIGEGDRTSEAIIPAELTGKAKIVAKQDLMVCGLGVAGGVFSSVDASLEIRQSSRDGDIVSPGTVVMNVAGSLRSILAAERVALNFLQRLCGIASMTREYVRQTAGTKTKILDTRKTVPLLRHLDKYAVSTGGGTNHRFGLFDGILVKDNHIAAMKGSIRNTLSRVKTKNPGFPIIVEIDSLDQIEDALKGGATRLLLDNMNDLDVAKAVKEVRGRTQIEVSGGITLERVKALSQLGVDYISVGALTHSPKAANLSLELEP